MISSVHFFFVLTKCFFAFLNCFNGTRSTGLARTLSILLTKFTNLTISQLLILFTLIINTYDKDYKSRKFPCMGFSSLFLFVSFLSPGRTNRSHLQ